MAHGVKYRIQYYRLGGGLTTIDILQRGYNSTITTLLGSGSPFKSSFEGDPRNIYIPTLGSGATIEIINTSPLSLLEFYTADPQEWKVQVWDGITDTDSDASSDGGGELRWQGFISPEIYTEGYSNPIASQITLHCNDGMSLLDKIAYKSTDIYTGKETIAEILTKVLTKLEISFNNVYTSIDLQVNDEDTNLFLYLSLFNENFLDENDEPKTCRWVLDSIIGGLGLVMYFEGDSIYIIDPINLHDDTKGKYYNFHTWGSEAAYALGGYLDISTRQIRWAEVGTNLDIISPYSEVLVKYDPYNFTELSYLFNDPNNWEEDGIFTDMTTYQLNTTVQFLGWTFDSIGGMEIAMKDTTYSIPEYALYFTNELGEAYYTFTRGVVIEDDALCLRLTMSVYIQTKVDSANIFDTGTTKTVTKLIIPFAAKINDQYWKGVTAWEADETSKYNEFAVFDAEREVDHASGSINDKWVTCHKDMPIYLNATTGSDILSGPVTIELKDNLYTQSGFGAQLLPGDTPFFSADTDVETNQFGMSGVTWARVNNTTIQITIVGLKTHANITEILLNSAVTAVGTTETTGDIIGGVWHEADHTPHNFSSSVANTTFTVISYTASTDTVVYNVITAGTPYFTDSFDHFDSASTTLYYTYGYIAFQVFIKDIKLEVIHSTSGDNIGNNGVEEKCVLNTNLTGKEQFVINTTTGIGPYGCSRGSLKSSQTTPANINITEMVRSDSPSEDHSTGEFILQSFMSQYKQPRFVLKGKLNTVNQPINLRTKLIKDTDNIGTRAFYIVKGMYSDKEETMDVELLEVTDTRESIL